MLSWRFSGNNLAAWKCQELVLPIFFICWRKCEGAAADLPTRGRLYFGPQDAWNTSRRVPRSWSRAFRMFFPDMRCQVGRASAVARSSRVRRLFETALRVKRAHRFFHQGSGGALVSHLLMGLRVFLCWSSGAFWVPLAVSRRCCKARRFLCHSLSLRPGELRDLVLVVFARVSALP